MSNNQGLPAFFQKTGKTVLDELHNPDLSADDDCALDISLSESTYAGLDLNDDEAFGDLQNSSLPDFFRTGTNAGNGGVTDADSLSFSALLSGNGASSNDKFLTPGDNIMKALLPTGRSAGRGPPGLGGPPGLNSGATSGPPGLPQSSPVTVAPVLPAANTTMVPAATTPAATATADAVPSLVVPVSTTQAKAAPVPAPPARASAPANAWKTNVSFAEILGGAKTHPVLSSGKEEAAADDDTQLLPPAPPVQFGSFGDAPIEADRGAGGNNPNNHNNASGSGVRGPNDVAFASGGPVKPTYSRGKFMTASDVRFIVNKVLQPMESSDPFSDDFYAIQLNIKRNKVAREAAAQAQSAPPPLLYVPLPTWRETKERIKSQMDATRRSLYDKSAEWEKQEQVLGHQQRNDVRTPKVLLSIPKADLGAVDEGSMPGDDSDSAPQFTSRLWTVRQAVQQGFEALFTVQELHHLCSSPAIASHPAARAEIDREIQTAVALLSHSIGIRTAMGGDPNSAFSLDGAHVGAILQMPKGKKLMSRSLKLLNQSHRWALLPVILSKILQSPAPSSCASFSSSASGSLAADSVNAVDSGSQRDNQSVDQKLLKTIIEFLQYSYQFQVEEMRFYMANGGPANPGLSTPFTNVLLSNLRTCVQTVMVTNMEKSRLRQSLLCDKSRAEVLHMIVQIADRVGGGNTVEPRLVEQWMHTRGAFMSLLDS